MIWFMVASLQVYPESRCGRHTNSLQRKKLGSADAIAAAAAPASKVPDRRGAKKQAFLATALEQ
ncbi:MAG: hypothetical protein NTX64_06975 [Elusimicrobia bacterium]|nr:hypothetical protein [Elusimicrobiota bacterium]